MKLRHRFLELGCLVALGAISASAGATTEPPALYDGRSMAMAGTGVSHIHNGASLYHNVAELQGIDQIAITADLSPSSSVLTAPVNGPGTEVESKASIIPLFLLGGAYRLSDRFVVGLAGYATGGFGTEYKLTVPGISKMQLGAFEISPGASFAITKDLAIGVGYRVTYMFQQAKAREEAPAPFPPGTIFDAQIDMTGTNFAGFDAGIFYRPIEALRLGFAYRSKVTTQLSGSTKLLGASFDTSTKFSFPHSFKLGAAYQVIEPLLVAVDVKYLLHAEANKESLLVTDLPGAPTEPQRLDWKNSISVGFGAEYRITPMVPVRAGYRITTSATPKELPGPFFTPPGLLHSVHAGAGLSFEHVDIDLGGFYSWGSSDLAPGAPPPPAGTPAPIPGTYSMKFVAAALSATYHQ